MSTQEIYHYIKVNDLLITAGQPTEEQLRDAAAEGFTTVINLATINPRYSLEDEGGLVKGLGMVYHPIPVEWDAPKESDFTAFDTIFQHLAVQKTLIHCAANFRVTAFYSLYALKRLGWTETQADDFRAAIWQGSDYPVWEAFIRQIKDKILQK